MRISDWSSDVCSSDLSPRSCCLLGALCRPTASQIVYTSCARLLYIRQRIVAPAQQRARVKAVEKPPRRQSDEVGPMPDGAGGGAGSSEGSRVGKSGGSKSSTWRSPADEKKNTQIATDQQRAT